VQQDSSNVQPPFVFGVRHEVLLHPALFQDHDNTLFYILCQVFSKQIQQTALGQDDR
jgi:hypothetical protein